MLLDESLIALGPFSLRLLHPASLEPLIDATALLRDEQVAEPPYWAHVWAGSRVLAQFVANKIECLDRRAIDLGCGLGLAGLAAAHRGARVLLTDHLFEPLELARRSAELNRLRVDTAVMDLRRMALAASFDLCLAADVTYDPALQAALADLFVTGLSETGEAWCVESVRTADRGFADALLARDLRVEERDLSTVDEGHTIAIRLTIARR